MKRMLITGGAGFVGSNLALAFKKDFPETEIICLDNLRRRGSELNVLRLQKAGITFMQGDIRNPEDLAAVGTFDTMLECSAEPSVMAGITSAPDYLLQTNLVGAINCFEAARKHNARVIFLSTSRVYPIGAIQKIDLEETPARLVPREHQTQVGISKKGISEKFTLHGPRSLYGSTKLAAELLLQEYGDTYKLPIIINRCGVLAGPWQMAKPDQGIVSFWVANHMFNRPLAYIGYGGTGKQVRDVLHIDDLYQALRIQLHDFSRHANQIYNIGGGVEVSTSLAELTELCREVTGHTVSISSNPETRAADIPYYVTDYSLFHSMTGWKPLRTMKDIVIDIQTWIKQNERELHGFLGL